MDDYVGAVVMEGVGVAGEEALPGGAEDGEGDDERFWSELPDGLGL